VCAHKHTDDIADAVHKHILAVRKRVAGMQLASAVVILESNLPLLAETIKRTLYQRSVPRCVVMHEDRKRGRDGAPDEVRAGTRTSRTNKPQMVAALKEVLAWRAMKMHGQFVVAQPEQQPQDEAHPRDNIVTELENFKVERVMRNVSKARRPYVREHLEYSGRHQHGGRARDDYVMALGFIMLMSTVFLSAPEYRVYR
jgi:hypothetical protein